MRNLKKVLALAVASVMLMGMMVVGTSAASFTDVDVNDNIEAIEVLKMVGVMAGDDKGNFNPDKAVTRNEMAVVMANLMDLEVSDYAGSTPFTDVPAWAEPYVAACYANGIVSGTSATTYGGDGAVTTAQAGLMVMKALGYFQYAVDFQGDWMLATVKQASKIDLFDGVATKATANLTRNDVAQLVLNALESKVQVCSVTGNNTNITAGDVNITIDVTTSYAADTNAIDYDGGADDGKAYLCEVLFGNELTKGTSTDDLSRPATLWTYAKTGETTKTVKVSKDADLAYVIADADLDTLAEIVTEEELTVDSSAVFVNGLTGTSTPYATASAWELNDGWVVEFFKGTDKEVEKVVGYAYEIFEITDVDAYDEEDSMTKDYDAKVLYTVKTLGGTPETDKYYVDYLNDDYAGSAYEAIGTFAKGTILTAIQKADGSFVAIADTKSVDGLKTAYGDGYVKVDGTKYTLKTGVSVAGNYTDTWTYYLDPNGVIIDGELKEAAEAALEYVYVISNDAQDEDTALLGTNKNKAVVKVMYLDGTKETVEYALTKVTATAGVTGQIIDDNSTAADPSDDTYTAGTIAKNAYYYTILGTKYEYRADMFEATVGTGFFAYTKNDAGQITLKNASKAEVSYVYDNVAAVKDTQLMWTDSTDNLYATSKTVVTVLDKDGVAKTFTGYKNFLASGATGALTDMDGALVIYGAKETEAAKVYYYETASAGYSVDGDKIEAAMYVSTGDTVDGGVVATFYVKGQKVTCTVTNDISALVAGQLVELTKDDDGNYSAATLTEGTDYVATTVDVVSDDYVVVGGVVVDLTSDCETYLVNAENKVMSKTELVAHDSRLAAIFVNSDGVYMVIIYKDMPAEVQ